MRAWVAEALLYVAMASSMLVRGADAMLDFGVARDAVLVVVFGGFAVRGLVRKGR